MLVFSIKKYVEDMGEKSYQSNKDWIDECEGKQVIFPLGSNKGYCVDNYYHIDRQWTVDSEHYESTKKKRGRPKKE